MYILFFNSKNKIYYIADNNLCNFAITKDIFFDLYFEQLFNLNK